jgi:PKHD-type hydroxylase
MRDIEFPRYVTLQNAVPHDVCDKIIQIGEQNGTQVATIGGNHMFDAKKRITDVSFIQDSWINGMLKYHMDDANVFANWNIDILPFARPSQYTVYNEAGHYSWHVDSESPSPEEYIKENKTFIQRKISIVLHLSDADYEGGDFQLHTGQYDTDGKIIHENIDVLKNKGTIIIFPSNIPHRVSPVTNGVRKSLVQWAWGPIWR